MNTNGWESDLADGEATEETIMKAMRQRGLSPIKIPGKFSAFDIFVPENRKTYEIKRDWKSRETGNIVIEIWMYGKPSGLMATEADQWIIDTGAEWIHITPQAIKDCIIQTGQKLHSFIGKGDKKSKKAYLIPKQQLTRYAIITRPKE